MRTYDRPPAKRKRDEHQDGQHKRRKIDDILLQRPATAYDSSNRSSDTIDSDPAVGLRITCNFADSTPPSSPVHCKQPTVSGPRSSNPKSGAALLETNTIIPPRVCLYADKENEIQDTRYVSTIQQSFRAKRPLSNFTKRLLQARENVDVRPTLASLSSEATNRVIRSGVLPPKQLTQATLDLGQASHLHCPACKMDYIPSNDKDVKAHRKYHDSVIGEFDVGCNWKVPLKRISVHKSIEMMGSVRRAEIFHVNHHSSERTQKRAQAALQHVNAEMAATDVPLHRLWARHVREGRNLTTSERRDDSYVSERHQVFLCVDRSKLVGLALVETLQQDDIEIHPPMPADCHPIIHQPHLLGVSRIWTSPSHRSQGVAKAMLDCALAHVVYGTTIPKSCVLFSAPTAAGTALAKSWLGRDHEFRTYLDKEVVGKKKIAVEPAITPHLDEHKHRKIDD